MEFKTLHPIQLIEIKQEIQDTDEENENYLKGKGTMDGGTLIALVQNYEELYNVKHPDYSNQQRRDSIWEEIGIIMKKPDKVCRDRWTRLRDNHRKALSLRKTKGGQKIKPPKFDKELTFLVPYLFDEDTRHSNISSPASLPKDNESEEDETNTDQNDMDRNAQLMANNLDISAPLSSRVSTSRITIRRKIKSAEEPTVVHDYLQTRKNVDQPTATQDILTNFFMTMAQTVKTFPLRDQIEIKAKLFQIVNSVEMRIANAYVNHEQSSAEMRTINAVPNITNIRSLAELETANVTSNPANTHSYYRYDFHQ